MKGEEGEKGGIWEHGVGGYMTLVQPPPYPPFYPKYPRQILVNMYVNIYASFVRIYNL